MDGRRSVSMLDPPFPRRDETARTRRRQVSALFLVAAALIALAGCRNGPAARTRVAAESRQLLDQARVAESHGHYREAADHLTAAIRRNPDDVELHRELARILLLQGNTQAAIDRLRGAVCQHPDDIGCYVQLADTLYREGAVQDAEPPLDVALGLNPRDVDALMLKARIASSGGRREEALETYYRVLAVDSEHVDARLRVAAIHLETSRCECAVALLRSIASSDTATGEQRAQAQRTLGRAYYREGRWDAASTALAAALPQCPDASTDEWYELAYAARMAGHGEIARSALTRTLRLNPKHTGAVQLAAAIDTDGEVRHAHADRSATDSDERN